ncbi:hypothetical protein PR001_g26997 [Phytophthora rubi]|uniref:DUF6818 domain-containing protein n=1 Tax=Phytophthora rubi TaxID=129364 RepID=A0A6A3HTR2_9STRA|nr:hypothetical protein PR001_g26997 [Phytophthora rubi]
MTKRHGSTNYSIGEMRRLLELVQASLPASRANWEAVAADYNAVKEPQWKRRDAMSLKRKFRSMSSTSHHGVGEARAHLASAASRVQQQMKLHRTLPRLQEIEQNLGQRESYAGTEPNGMLSPELLTLAPISRPVRDAEQRPLCPEDSVAQEERHPDLDKVQLLELHRQHKSNRRVARRRHKELLHCVRTLKVSLETFAYHQQ